MRFARDEFKRNKEVKDIVCSAGRGIGGRIANWFGVQTQIRYLISTGKTQWETMERYIDGL